MYRVASGDVLWSLHPSSCFTDREGARTPQTQKRVCSIWREWENVLRHVYELLWHQGTKSKWPITSGPAVTTTLMDVVNYWGHLGHSNEYYAYSIVDIG